MFDIIYGWRKWRRNKLQGILLLCGFAVFVSLMSLVLVLAPQLFNDRPDWVAADGSFATVGLQGPDGRMQPATLERIAWFEQLKGIDDVGLLGEHSGIRFSLLDQHYSDTVLVISENLPEMLRLPVFSREPNVLSQQAYLTQQFIVDNQLSPQSVIGKPLLVGEHRKPLIVAGILPASMNKPLRSRVAFAISSHNASELVDVNFGDARPDEATVQQIKQQVVKNLPSYKGVLSLSPGYNPDSIELNDVVRTRDDTGIQFWGHSEGLAPYITGGVVFHPDTQAELQRQWWIIFLLAIMFGLINTLALLTLCFNQCLQRAQEFSLRVALGARFASLCRQVLLEQLPLLVGALALGLLLSGSVFLLLMKDYQAIIKPEAPLMAMAIIVTSGLLTLLVAVSACLPLWRLLSQRNFHRDQNDDLWQHRLSLLNMLMQMSFAGIALAMTLSVSYSQWQQFQNLEFDARVLEWLIEPEQAAQQQTFINVSDWVNEINRYQRPFALSEWHFLQPRTFTSEARLETPDNPVSVNASLLSVSANYFSVLGMELSAGDTVSESGIVVNLATLNALGIPSPEQALGRSVYLNNPRKLGFRKDTTLRIKGVVKNFPHFGIQHQQSPFIYADLSNQSQLALVSVLTPVSHQDEVNDWLDFVQAQQGIDLSIRPQPVLIEQLKQDNAVMHKLMIMSLVMGVMICSLAVGSLYYQIKTHLQLQQRRYAVMLAVGAQDSHVLFLIWRLLGILVVVASIITIGVVSSLQDRVTQELELSLMDPIVWLLTWISLLVIALASSLLPSFQLIRRPLAQLLRYAE